MLWLMRTIFLAFLVFLTMFLFAATAVAFGAKFAQPWEFATMVTGAVLWVLVVIAACVATDFKDAGKLVALIILTACAALSVGGILFSEMTHAAQCANMALGAILFAGPALSSKAVWRDITTQYARPIPYLSH